MKFMRYRSRVRCVSHDKARRTACSGIVAPTSLAQETMLQVFDDGSEEVDVLIVDNTGCHMPIAVAEILSDALQLAAGSASAMARSHLPISRGGGGFGAGGLGAG